MALGPSIGFSNSEEKGLSLGERVAIVHSKGKRDLYERGLAGLGGKEGKESTRDRRGGGVASRERGN